MYTFTCSWIWTKLIWHYPWINGVVGTDNDRLRSVCYVTTQEAIHIFVSTAPCASVDENDHRLEAPNGCSVAISREVDIQGVIMASIWNILYNVQNNNVHKDNAIPTEKTVIFVYGASKTERNERL